MAHDVKLPSEFEEKNVMDVIVSLYLLSQSGTTDLCTFGQEKAVVSEWFAGPSLINRSLL